MTYRVLVTDYAWPTLDIERKVLAAAGAELIVPKTGSEDELFALAPEADAILVNWNGCTARVIANAPKCRIITRYGVGVDNIAIDAATERGIIVCNPSQRPIKRATVNDKPVPARGNEGLLKAAPAVLVLEY